MSSSILSTTRQVPIKESTSRRLPLHCKFCYEKIATALITQTLLKKTRADKLTESTLTGDAAQIYKAELQTAYVDPILSCLLNQPAKKRVFKW